MSKFSTPHHIGRLDRAAMLAGIDLRQTGKNKREFDAHGRTFKYKPQGAGVVLLEAFIEDELEAYHVCHPDRVIAIWERM